MFKKSLPVITVVIRRIETMEHNIFGPRREKAVFGGLRTAKAQTSLRIRAV